MNEGEMITEADLRYWKRKLPNMRLPETMTTHQEPPPSQAEIARARVEGFKAARARLDLWDTDTSPAPQAMDERTAEVHDAVADSALDALYLVHKACGDVPWQKIIGDARTARVIVERHVVMFLLFEHTQNSYPTCGRLLHRDHSTVHHGCKMVRRAAEIAADKTVSQWRRDRAREILKLRSQMEPLFLDELQRLEAVARETLARMSEMEE